MIWFRLKRNVELHYIIMLSVTGKSTIINILSVVRFSMEIVGMFIGEGYGIVLINLRNMYGSEDLYY